jgi:ribosomal protein S18 acetylase RimI-like enzyme
VLPQELDLGAPGVAEQVLAVQRAAYAVEAELVGDDRIPPLHEPLEVLRRSRLHWLGAVEEGRLVGALAWADADGVVDVHRLVIHPDRARRGVGRALVRELLARTDRADVVVSTGRDNLPARRLYESLGFRVVGEVEVLPGLTVTRYELLRSATSSTS